MDEDGKKIESEFLFPFYFLLRLLGTFVALTLSCLLPLLEAFIYQAPTMCCELLHMVS